MQENCSDKPEVTLAQLNEQIMELRKDVLMGILQIQQLDQLYIEEMKGVCAVLKDIVRILRR